MQLIQGALIAEKIIKEVAQKISALPGKKPGLAFVRIGEDPASKVYIEIKKKKCKEVGILSFDHELRESISEQEVIELLSFLNKNPDVHGILIQLPIPKHLSSFALLEKIAPHKDVDGFHSSNMGKLLLGESEGFIPCTPLGIHRLLIESNLPVAGKHAVILGRSNIVGKPLAALLMQKSPLCNATVTVAHSASLHLPALCKQADILIAAIGKPRFVSKHMVKPGAIVIDVGINRISQDNQPILVGDVDFEEVAPLCSHITPVPGGVGPMTVALLMENTLKARLKNFSV
jgi:methylenetetrahydrofolate dehydrogenase (NADP+)/methenyltetrahydrofolate cyclohydrolase